MTKQLIQLSLIMIAFSACSDEFIADQIADNYMHGNLTCPSLDVEEEFQNIVVTDLMNGTFEINLGSTLGLVEGTISDDSEIEVQAYKGTSSNGVDLDFNFGTGSFYLEELERGVFKNIFVNLQTPEQRINICTLIINKN